MKLQLHQISSRLWYMDNTVETDRPSLGYIRGDKFAAVVDAGNSPAHYNEFLALLDEHGLPHPDFCIITHSHWDHTFGLCALNIPSFACEKTAEHLREEHSWSFTDPDGQGTAYFNGDACMQAEYASAADICIALPTATFSDKLTLDLGGVHAEAIFVGGPHSDDGVIVWVPEEAFIFAGDSSAGNFALPNIAYELPLLDAYVDVLQSLPFERFMHAHRPIMTREETFKHLADGRARGYYTFD
ncbi:MAG: MBL fold metallo-hydrolase [Oscillospiraceae bacterium]|nr:MBL fold metallo-hydrolase [Oscillospiraceae bacterium]